MRIITSAVFACICTLLAAQDLRIDAGQQVGIVFPEDCRPVAFSALEMLKDDFRRVLGSELLAVTDAVDAQIIAQIGDAENEYNDAGGSDIGESFRISVCDGRLYIYGSDSHGLAYGLLEVSRLLGVSPWEWWADCTPHRLSVFRVGSNYHTHQYPLVRYRGIFINDEDWGLLPWATAQEPELAADVLSGHYGRTSAKGVIGPKVNERIFQLMLRLHANYYWPAMHECSQPFFTIPGNREMAERYGIYIGGSHCEPMACSTATEWPMRGEGDYNYVSNSDAVKAFWQKRLDEVKGQEIVYTIGMRGLHDGAMQGTRTMDEKVRYLQQVIDDQRRMLAATLQLPADSLASVPQVFVPYKEVLDIYKGGLVVPDDVTLMWTDDNYGYIRHFPDSVERLRSGGHGVYYHASYWGRPHDYLWLSTTSPYLMRQQMDEAMSRGIDRMWILNVGDIKPAEYIIERWMDLAWCADEDNDEDAALRLFMSREFGESLGVRLAEVMSQYYRLAYIRKPEFMGGTRTEESDRTYWAQHHPIEGWTRGDAEFRLRAYRQLSDRVEQLAAKVEADRRDAFFQLVKYPVQASAQMNIKFLAATKHESDMAYDSIVSLTRIYNSNPRWTGILDMHPRRLTVFNRVEEPLAYPDRPLQYKQSIDLGKIHGHHLDGLGYNADAMSLPQGEAISIDLHHKTTTDTLHIELHLLPSHPIDGPTVAVEVGIDSRESLTLEYQTYDRSEEWKQNVLRNQAIRIATLPLPDSRRNHKIRIKALTPGVVIDEIYWW